MQPNKDILLIYLPGAMLSGKDYQSIFTSLQQLQSYHQQAGINLFLVCPPVNWMVLASLPAAGPGDGGIHQVNAAGEDAFNAALEAAVNAGFKPDKTFSGKINNAYVAMHSIAAMWAMQAPMKRSAGVAFIGASIVTQPGFSWPGVHDFPQPVLHIWGSMDGQYRSTRAALVVADAAQTIAQLGPIRAAAQNPLLLVPGMNHAQQSNGIPNVARGDLLPDQVSSLEGAGKEIAMALSAFIIANNAPSSSSLLSSSSSSSGLEAKSKALMTLKAMTSNTIDTLSPYLAALGRALPTTEGEGEGSSLLFSSFARGAEAASPPSQAYAAHPGEIATAKSFCEYAQRRCLQAAAAAGAGTMEGDPMLENIHVTAIVHTSLENFIRSQPRIYSPIITTNIAGSSNKNGDGNTGNNNKTGDGNTERNSSNSSSSSLDSKWVLQVHCYLRREWLEPNSESWLKNSSPEYYLKLKKGVAVGLEMKRRKEEEEGEEEGKKEEEGDDAKTWGGEEEEGIVSAAELHRELYNAALSEVSPVFGDVYTKRGRVLEFGKDRDVSREIDNPIDWMVKFHNEVVGGGGVLISPKVSTEICVEKGSNINGKGEMRKFYGNHYIKVKSKAWFHEWIMVDGLRG
jgi:hypothetical protein